MKIVFKLSPLLLLLGLPACAQRPVEPAAEASLGKAYFAGYGCVTCHRVDGKGGVLGPDLTYIGFRKSPEWLDAWLKNPSAWKKNTLMPNFYFKDDVRKDLVAYLATLKGQGYQGALAPWRRPQFADDPVKRGEAIFKSVGCVGCHGVNGQGGQPNNNVAGNAIPTLTLVADGYSKDELAKKIRLGSHPQKDKAELPDPMIYMPTWGQVLSDDDINALVEYLYSLRPAKPAGEAAW